MVRLTTRSSAEAHGMVSDSGRIADVATRTPDHTTGSRDRRAHPRPCCACSAITGDYRRFSPARPKSGHLRPKGMISSNAPETTGSSTDAAFRMMARPGLEPGTPRFSAVRSSRAKAAKSLGRQWVCADGRRAQTPANCTLFHAVQEMVDLPPPLRARGPDVVGSAQTRGPASRMEASLGHCG